MFKDKAIAENDCLCLFFLQITDVLSVVKTLQPEDTINFLRYYLELYEGAINKLGGTVVRAESNCILAAWSNDAEKCGQDYIDIAFSLLRQKDQLDIWTSDHKCLSADILISISRGECIFEMEEGNYTQMFGLVVSRVEQMSAQYRGEKGIVLIDESIKDDSIRSAFLPVSKNVYKVEDGEIGQLPGSEYQEKVNDKF